MNLKNRDFLKLLDFTAQEIEYLLELAADFKQKKKDGVPHKILEGKNIALIFEKTSTRTRCSFETAAYDLGMGVTYLDPSASQIGKKESIADTARVLSGIYDGIAALNKKLLRSLRSIQAFPSGTGLPMNFTPPRYLPIS